MAHRIAHELDRAYRVAREAVAEGQVGSVVLAVADHERIIRQEAITAPDDPDHGTEGIYLLASITKTFFGTAFTQLAERGKLLLCDAVTRHLPEFSRNAKFPAKEKVTLWHLLTHTSGLAEETWNPLWQQKAPAEKHVEAACDAFVQYEPGTAYQYCNLSFWALAEVLQRVTGRDYGEYLRQAIIEPLGMADTAFGFEGQQAQRMMPVHTPSGDPLVGSEEMLDYFCSLRLPAGGLWSTSTDLVRYGQALLGSLTDGTRTVVSPAGIATMTRLQTAGIDEHASGVPARYGLGWAVDPARACVLDSRTGFGHGGATGTLLWIDPRYDLVYVFLTNVWGNGDQTAYRVLNAVLAGIS